MTTPPKDNVVNRQRRGTPRPRSARRYSGGDMSVRKIARHLDLATVTVQRIARQMAV